jgi:hypothetical protein
MRKFISTNSETNSTPFGFERAAVADEVAVNDLFVCRCFMSVNKVDGVGADDALVSLCKTSRFVGQTSCPCGTIFATQESVDGFLFALGIACVIELGLKCLDGLQMLQRWLLGDGVAQGTALLQLGRHQKFW